eukprot:6209288-Pleurochrysis_carterae.AAC.2
MTDAGAAPLSAQQGYWPTYPPVEVRLPQEILELQERARLGSATDASTEFATSTFQAHGP